MNKPNAKEIASLTLALERREYPSGSLLASECAVRGLPNVTRATKRALARRGLVRMHERGVYIVA